MTGILRLAVGFLVLVIGSSQSVRIGFIGGEVLLPCIYPGQLPNDVSASWRDRNDEVVLDIINGTPDKIDSKFKGRVLSFPGQYKQGNLSIVIKDLREDDAGSYECYIPGVDYDNKYSIDLRITEKPAVAVTSPRRVPPAPPLTPAPRDAAVPSSLHPTPLLDPLFLLFHLFISYFLH